MPPRTGSGARATTAQAPGPEARDPEIHRRPARRAAARRQDHDGETVKVTAGKDGLLSTAKRRNRRLSRARQTRLPVILLAAGLSACVSGGGEDWRIHYVSFGASAPQGNRVTVCHAYTCKLQTPYTFKRRTSPRFSHHEEGQARRQPLRCPPWLTPSPISR
jgi:hypothetical protein